MEPEKYLVVHTNIADFFTRDFYIKMEPEKYLVVHTNIADFFTRDFYTDLFDEYHKDNFAGLLYKVLVQKYGIIDEEKLLNKIEKEMDEQIEAELDEAKEITVEIIKNLNIKKLKALDELKREINLAIFLSVNKEYKIKKDNFVQDILKSSYEIYENHIKPILLIH